MDERIRRLERQAERAARALDTLGDEPELARIALIGVLCAAAVCWFAMAWGDPRVLVLLPIVAGGTVWVSREKRRQSAARTDDVELEPAPAEVDEWLARLPATPEPFAAPAAPSTLAAPPPAEARVEQPDVKLESQPATGVYEVREVRAGAHAVLEVRDSFDAAVDVAFELIEERDPPALEIVVVDGGEHEIVWSYTREAAQAEKHKGSLELFGFDAERWTQARR